MPHASVGKLQSRIRERVEHLIGLIELVVVIAAEVLLAIAVVIAGLVLYDLFASGMLHSIRSVDTVDELQGAVEHVFAGVLLLVLGLELMKSLQSFFEGLRFQVEIIVIVAIIAVARHVLLIDWEHAKAETVLAAAGLVLALAVSYALVRQREPDRAEDVGPSE
jgi:uncharacterized membrane protein (DUF373 family)